MLYGTECGATKKQHIHKMRVIEMRLLIWISGITQKDRIQNEKICLKISVAPIDEKIRESHLRYLVMFKEERLMQQLKKVN